MDFKYFWNGVNTGLIFLVFMYVFITKDINTRAYEKAVEIEKRVDHDEKRADHDEKRLDHVEEKVARQDSTTKVVNIYNYYKK